MKLILTISTLALSASATRIYAYTTNDCTGSFRACTAPAGTCCSTGGNKVKSVQALLPPEPVQAFVASGSNKCGSLLGGSSECFGVSGSQIIAGAHWTASVDLEEREAMAEAECVEADYVGVMLEGKRYMIETRGMLFEDYEKLGTTEERNAFLMKRADVVEDVE